MVNENRIQQKQQPKIIKANRDAVYETCSKLQQEGVELTTNRIRNELGGGGWEAIGRYLAEWQRAKVAKARHADKSPVELTQQPQEGVVPLYVDLNALGILEAAGILKRVHASTAGTRHAMDRYNRGILEAVADVKNSIVDCQKQIEQTAGATNIPRSTVAAGNATKELKKEIEEIRHAITLIRDEMKTFMHTLSEELMMDAG